MDDKPLFLLRICVFIGVLGLVLYVGRWVVDYWFQIPVVYLSYPGGVCRAVQYGDQWEQCDSLPAKYFRVYVAESWRPPVGE